MLAPRPHIIFLVGYMACGKTTLGRALAADGAGLFVDLDEYIARQSGLTPAEWFASRGEAAFRAAERRALESIADSAAPADGILIVACGGGTPCHSDAMEFMNSRGTTVWLRADIDRTIARILDAGDSRPLVAGKSADELRKFIGNHLAERTPYYIRAHASFDTSRLDNPEELAEAVDLFKKQLNIPTHKHSS